MRKRDIQKTFWLNYNENKKLKDNSKKCGLSESQYIRMLINGYKPREEPTDILYDVLRQMKGIGNNLMQIARKANALNLIDAQYYQRNYEKFKILEEDIKRNLLGVK